MRITITLEDAENNHVKMETDPVTTKLVRIAREEKDKVTPALAYAMKALSSIMKDSLEQGQREGIIPDGSIRPLWCPPKKKSDA